MSTFLLCCLCCCTLTHSLHTTTQDEDTRCVLNTMANPHNLQLEFYVISCEWMNAVLPFLMLKTLVKPELPIHNAPLISSEHAVSSDDDEEDGSRNKKWRETKLAFYARQDADFNMKPLLKHEEDYFLIGPNAWTILSTKFGYDYALPRKVKTSCTAESRMGVQVYPNQWPVDVPPSGRFSYESAAPVVADDVSETEDSHDMVRYCCCV